MILIVNDDGYESYNLNLLYRYCSSIDDDVKFVVPFNDMSCMGNKFSLSKTFNSVSDDRGFIIDGTPLDCLRFGLSKFSPDLIISGVNNGFNIGWETLLCSGTFMSAREGCLKGVKSLSCSFDKYSTLKYSLLEKVLDEVLEFNFKLGNLNIVSNYVMISTVCDSIYDYSINDNTVTVWNKSEFPQGSDGDIVFNQKQSSLTILK